VFTNNGDGWRTVTDAIAAGSEIASVIDWRADARASLAGVQTLAGWNVTKVHGGHGGLSPDVSIQSASWNPQPMVTKR